MNERTLKVSLAPVAAVLACVVVLAALSPGAPTGHTVIDLLERVALVGTVTWIGSRTPTMVLIPTVGIVGALAFREPSVGVGVLVVVAILTVWEMRSNAPDALRAAVAAAGVLGGFHLPEIGGFGRSALAAALIAAVIVGFGWRRHGPDARRRMRRGAIVAAAAAGVTLVGAGLSFWLASMDAGAARRQMRQAIESTNAGSIDEATLRLERAKSSLDDVQASLDRPWGWLGNLIPVVAQQRRVAIDLAGEAATTVGTALDAVQAADLGNLKVADGKIDLIKVAGVAAPMERLANAIDQLQGRLATERPDWLLPPIDRAMDQAAVEMDRNHDRVLNLVDAAKLAPDFLGASGERRIFLAFLTPSEARPLGGHMANYGELLLKDGKLQLDHFGRAGDLITASADPATRIISGPQSYLDRYGVFGAGGNGTPAGPDWWLDVTISPDFPSVAQVMSEMYTKATGRIVDDVLAIDPSALAGLLEITGPVTANGIAEPLTGETVVQLLEHDQYAKFGRQGKKERVEFLGDAGQATFDALLGRRRLDPISLVKHLAKPAAQGHLRLWSSHTDAQALYEKVHISGDFARPPTPASFALTTLNSGANKTDAFLQRTVRYDATIDDATGKVSGTIEVTLRNDSPADGLPAHVIGNSVGEPPGTNRTYLTLYSGDKISSVQIDNADVVASAGTELGWNYAERRFSLAPGSSTTIRYQISGTIDRSQPYQLFIRSQPLPNPDQLSVQVQLASGELLAHYEGLLEQNVTLDTHNLITPTGG